jgi:hypothetical protein
MYWKNSNFQYLYFVFGTCHTLIEAHRKCLSSLMDRQISFEEAESAPIFDEKCPIKSKMMIESFEQSMKEIEFLKECLRRFEQEIGYVPTNEDYQAIQEEEWKHELCFRAETLLLCTGTIEPSQFTAIRQHPKFSEILAYIEGVRLAISKNEKILYYRSSNKVDKILNDAQKLYITNTTEQPKIT